jgi:hypothetical protein
MAEESQSRAYRWVLPLLVGIFCGGLGGSVFTWYVNRPKLTVVTYRIATTTLSAPEAVGLIPDLKVLIAGKPIQALYAHNIELLPRQGPFVEQADIAFSFSSSVRVYGIHLESPSALHYFECGGLAANPKRTIRLPDSTIEINAVQCAMKPIFFQAGDTHPFRITIATDSSEIPRVQMAAKSVELIPADQFSSKDRASLPPWLLSYLFTMIGLFVLAVGIWFVTFERHSVERTQVEYQQTMRGILEEFHKLRSLDKHT